MKSSKFRLICPRKAANFMLRFVAAAFIVAVLPLNADVHAQPVIPKPPQSQAKADSLIGKLVMPIAGAKLRREDRKLELSDVPAPFIVRKTEGDWLWVGRAWIKREQVVPVEEALNYYTQWIEKNPNDSWAYDFRATVFHERGNLERALADHSKAIELRPSDPHYFNNRGLVLFELEQPDAAEADYSEAIKLDPKFAMAYCNRGALRLGSGDLNKAMADYQSALDSDAECAEAYNGLAWIHATSLNVNFRDGKKAVELATKAAKLTGYNDLAILDTLAAAHAEAGEWGEAVKQQKRAIEIAKDSSAYIKDARERLELYQAKKPYRE
jgi:tetratricopeptide (TPR) repeat protein